MKYNQIGDSIQLLNYNEDPFLTGKIVVVNRDSFELISDLEQFRYSRLLITVDTARLLRDDQAAIYDYYVNGLLPRQQQFELRRGQ
jgi:hypothetical protein